MKKVLKCIVYLPYKALCLVLWKMTGSWRIRVGGTTLKLEPSTQVPKHRGFRFPRSNWNEEIVKYSGSVQMRALLKVLCTSSKAMVVVEDGAFNGGYAAILASIMAKREGGRFIAIEPNPTPFCCSRRTLQRITWNMSSPVGMLRSGIRKATAVWLGTAHRVTQWRGPFRFQPPRPKKIRSPW